MTALSIDLTDPQLPQGLTALTVVKTARTLAVTSQESAGRAAHAIRVIKDLHAAVDAHYAPLLDAAKDMVAKVNAAKAEHTGPLEEAEKYLRGGLEAWVAQAQAAVAAAAASAATGATSAADTTQVLAANALPTGVQARRTWEARVVDDAALRAARPHFYVFQEKVALEEVRRSAEALKAQGLPQDAIEGAVRGAIPGLEAVLVMGVTIKSAEALAPPAPGTAEVVQLEGRSVEVYEAGGKWRGKDIVSQRWCSGASKDDVLVKLAALLRKHGVLPTGGEGVVPKAPRKPRGGAKAEPAAAAPAAELVPAEVGGAVKFVDVGGDW